ncbi:hypothetical protein L1987_53943 [Smallanthus sonchifolius]|uniref:Uncharacterized protein n=1 Tax=Smallanthus sonchifolius TaxID=185202 RepID=A0ACB9E653_9ASTR|nr:hypothetical protein L1987_53943 [Smallanthus sonchifolius]
MYVNSSKVVFLEGSRDVSVSVPFPVKQSQETQKETGLPKLCVLIVHVYKYSAAARRTEPPQRVSLPISLHSFTVAVAGAIFIIITRISLQNLSIVITTVPFLNTFQISFTQTILKAMVARNGFSQVINSPMIELLRFSNIGAS